MRRLLLTLLALIGASFMFAQDIQRIRSEVYDPNRELYFDNFSIWSASPYRQHFASPRYVGDRWIAEVTINTALPLVDHSIRGDRNLYKKHWWIRRDISRYFYVEELSNMGYPTTVTHSHSNGTVPLPPPFSDSEFSNMSIRLDLEQGETAIAGFVIEGTGSTPKKVLIRALGPSIRKFVENYLRSPKITVYRSLGGGASEKIKSNSQWTSDWPYDVQQEVMEIVTRVGALPFLGRTFDAALVLDLRPGAYTIHAESNNPGEGTVLIEVYEVDD